MWLLNIENVYAFSLLATGLFSIVFTCVTISVWLCEFDLRIVRLCVCVLYWNCSLRQVFTTGNDSMCICGITVISTDFFSIFNLIELYNVRSLLFVVLLRVEESFEYWVWFVVVVVVVGWEWVFRQLESAHARTAY